MKILRKYASTDNFNSFSSNFRKRRFLLFLDFLKNINVENPKIIDIGGTCNYWDLMNKHHQKEIKPVVVNISEEQLKNENCFGIRGDGKSLSFIKDKSCDVVYSNSMIEHLSSLDAQIEMVKNIQRVATFCFVQTPAFISPLEPHFLFPFFHWLPRKVRIKLVSNFSLGWFEKCQNQLEAEKLIDSIRIMKKKELKLIFENAKIITERYFFIPKSYLITNLI
ncbi:MAG: class I SAM-dependent methyltransferase [Ignavibacteria bacterium]|nr:class I SAM-dependent methyltransferase [Ignavibacteria bacterium]MBT8381560.1 class I SAM-dependent methyltransferase [Ignavibacteria bacterium]MBT8392342.1 class I SAM-dependent methyltransferase [Ignavibacteria bacterium]NNL22234.1 class I SAM-dependent methyltransferase [Ignavibacteriaceae bacterium]